MKHLIDKDALVAEIKRIEYETNYEPFTDEVLGKRKVCKDIKDFLNTLEEKDVDYPCDENRDKELALSLQIQAYLNTASDELYGNGKPLYSKSHLEGIHECMKMWVKLHDYYFYKHTCENKEVDLEKEFGKYLDVNNIEYGFQVKLFDFAKHFYELGLKAQKGE